MTLTSAAPEPPPQAPPLPPHLGPNDYHPLRAELGSPGQLAGAARALAAEARVAARPSGRALLARLWANGRFLAEAHLRVAASAGRQEPLTPDAEWLLDNFYVVEEVLRLVRTDLPRGYYDQLPTLAAGPLAGWPRVYALAVALVARTDSGLDEGQLLAFVRAYQERAPLTIGELWAVPTMLRLALLENLRRLAAQLLQARADRDAAERWAAQAHAPAERAGALPPAPRDAFLVALLQALRDHAAVGPDAERLNDWLAAHVPDTAEALRREHRRQAANQVSIGNCVTSLRLLAALDWNAFFEKASLVEEVLRGEPTGVYARQDFATRDRYRQGVEKLARGARLPEVEVARRAVARAAAAAPDPRAGHVGWHLVAEGRPAFEATLGYRAKLGDRWVGFLTGHPDLVYFGALGVLTAAVVAAAVALAGPGAWWVGALVALAVLLPASDLAVGLTNYLVCRLLPPRVLPKLDFKEGIPPEYTAFVVIPGMLIRADSAALLLERLELHYLANPDARLRFALLTDFADAPAEHMPEDDALVRSALEGVRALNERHAPGGPDRFFVFHRRRLFNPVQGCWMGWERKRGKLGEFNALLRGAAGTSYAVRSSDPAGLPRTRFVLTLDADTVLPREAAARLVGVLAHPLNQPALSADGRRVAAGYGVLQPRVDFLYATGRRSWFARIFAGSAGVDPYSSATSDVYQDLFGRGSYTGKGLYDVDAFEATAGRAFPEDTILSHDLIESAFARCGLVTDIEVFDDFPAKYHAYARREHRWARGDWQLLPWLNLTVPVPGGRAANVLPLLERWKVVDNLRRSLLPPALVLLLALGWTVLPGAAWGWTLFALLVLALPLLLHVLDGVINFLRGARGRSVLLQARANLGDTAGQVALSATFLADQACILLDAVGRTLYRMAVSRRRLLEWETAAATEQRLGGELPQFLSMMWPSLVLALLLGAGVAVVSPASLPAALPLLLLWLAAPAVAWRVSQPLPPAEPPLADADRAELRRAARKTWGFFEQFVGPDDHWLPPDNFQEDPPRGVAHRTSPTNQGMLLLSTLAAHDLGYLTLPQLTRRLAATFETLQKLERHRGHFLNWYDTSTLKPLPPAYVSTVDSGNLLGCLLALKRGLLEKLAGPVPGPAAAAGLADAARLFAAELTALRAPDTPAAGPWPKLDAQAAELLALAEAPPPPGDLRPWAGWLARLAECHAGLGAPLRALAESLGARPDELVRWHARLGEQVQARREELRELAPWLEVLGADEAALGERGQALVAELTTPAGVGAWERRLPALREEVLAVRGGLADALERSAAPAWAEELRRLADDADELAEAMDFRFLYNPDRHLFSIGYNVALGRLDPAHYDLLASEACLASFLAVARGEVPRRHWFQLGRLSTAVAGQQGLLSWGGTMFEYLMPRLLLPVPRGTLLDAAQRAAVARQREYGRQTRLPWGVSESAFNVLDAAQDYQYQSFGVPGLGLKRGLADDRVVAPYATLLAVPVDPRAAVANFGRLRAEGGEGAYGFYEAIDFTPGRQDEGRRAHVVRSYMAHHQGMGLVAVANALTGDAMVRRFRAEPAVRAAELLLQERVPLDAPLVRPHDEATGSRQVGVAAYPVSRRLTSPDTPAPRTHLLSNGRYTALVTNAGGGYSVRDGLDVSRWRPDRTRDHWGQFCYIRDLQSQEVWSAGYQPTRKRPDTYEVIYSIDKAEFRRLDGEVESLLEVTVSPEVDVEVRRLTLHNHGDRPRELELTSYVEVVLGEHGADLAHPGFGKLFLQTEWLPDASALLCRRRPRSAAQKPVWAVHVLAADGAAGEVTFETDRARFLGRRRTPEAPQALDPDAPPLSGAVGPVLDPVLCLRVRVRVEPGASAVVAFSTGVADTREEALALTGAYQTLQAVTRVFEVAWAHSGLELRHLGVSVEDAQLYQRLAGHVLMPGSALRAPADVLAKNAQGQSGLWRYGISGDLPIVLVRLAAAAELPLWRQLLAAHTYLRHNGFRFDLLALLEEMSGYHEELFREAQALVRDSDARDLVDRPGGVFLRKTSHLTEEDRVLLLASARVVLSGDHGPLGAQIDVRSGRRSGAVRRRRRPAAPPERTPTAPRPELHFFNGVGGFTPDGTEYVVRAGATPPAPWCNVIANPSAGCLVSDGGVVYTWAGNSQTNRLTPWSNDPVSDPPGEAVYLRDEATGAAWSPTPLPVRSPTPTRVRHGRGYTVFEQRRGALEQELTVFVPPDDPVKLLVLVLRNRGAEARRLSATFYAEWVLGTTREQNAAYVVTEEDAETGALLARNAFNPDFGAAVAFADVSDRPRAFTADRGSFLGRNGTLAAPAALEHDKLSGRTGPGLDPCAALQTTFEVAPGGEKVVVFVLGQAPDLAGARRLAQRYRAPDEAGKALDEARRRWQELLGAVQVATPDPALDVVLNGWLLYQVTSCRLWGRSAFYQSGGAYGFRDQLQDVMALVYAAPGEARAHLLRAAQHQFVEGDVLHWWHPPAGRGVRTRFSDDFLWLVFVACHYAAVTGDAEVFDEHQWFLRAAPLGPEQEEVYGLPTPATGTAPLYEHCVRALDHGWRLGAHGLPLMGIGDWNDGMNKVGAGGKGESVWVAWFQICCLRAFAPVAAARGDAERAQLCRERAEELRAAVEAHGWDGAWYLRAFFDDGTPLGSAANDECQIDSLVQSWAVLSEVADPARAEQGVRSAEARLVKRGERLILLFDPPFDAGPLQPGYIKGYVPGIRENGGQYTHAATWLVQAVARLGRGGDAHALFDLLNPVGHALDADGVALYKVEPYVVAADVYGRPPHVGRGGWTWYTGSAAWLYRVGLEDLLGFRRHGDKLRIDPRVPASWPGFTITYRHGAAVYAITVENPHGVEAGVARVWLDGQVVEGGEVALVEGEGRHEVRVEMGEGPARGSAGRA